MWHGLLKGTLLPKIEFWVDFSYHWYLFVMNADHKFAALDWNYASVQDTAGHSELNSIDSDFPTFEIDQNKLIDVLPSTSRALILQEPVIYFDQSADPAKYSKIAKFFSLDANPCHKCVIELNLLQKWLFNPKYNFWQ